MLFIKKSVLVVMKFNALDLKNLYKGESSVLLEQVKREREFLAAPVLQREFYPYKNFVEAYLVASALGKEQIMENRVGALMLAGGMGSRLRFTGAKGCFPIYQGKSLYQLAVEGIKRVKSKRPLQLAIMTSESTDKESRDFFKKNNFFGLDASQVDFFCQKSWPLLDFDGNIFLQSPTEIAMGPNGNGEALSLFVKSDIFSKWRNLGIEQISLFPVDNPLAEPFNSAFIAHHVRSGAEVSLAVAKKHYPEEKMGVVALCKNKLTVIEYMELTERQKELFIYGNLALILFSMDFAERVEEVVLPLHVAKKAVKKFTEQEGEIFPREANAYKFEQFIFDLLDYSKRSEALVLDRASSFAPLKELEGPDGIESVQRALVAKGVT